METDTVAPSPLILLRLPKFPELPTLRKVVSGDDLENLIREELGGEPEGQENPGPYSAAVGVTKVVFRGDIRVHVHTNPAAERNLMMIIDELKEQISMMEMLKSLGLNVDAPRADGCFCGQCPVDDDEPEEFLDRGDFS